MTAIHIMLDLETWGTEPGCDIRSIGACVFDPMTDFVGGFDPTTPRSGATFSAGNSVFYVATDNPTEWLRSGGQDIATRRYPLTRDPKTIAWWSDPERAEASQAFTNPIDLKDALTGFHRWLRQVTFDCRPLADDGLEIGLEKWEGLRLWSHGPSFDPVILAAAYRAVGLPLPWHYRAPRDSRTTFDDAGVEDHSAFLDRFSTGTFHHALDDAICQARAVCAARQMMRLPDDVRTHRSAWRNAIVGMIETTEHPDDTTGYWSHELRAFDRTFNALDSMPHHGAEPRVLIPMTGTSLAEGSGSTALTTAQPFDGIGYPIDELELTADMIAPTCQVPPPGWQTTREAGHDGPCAAVPVETWATDQDVPG